MLAIGLQGESEAFSAVQRRKRTGILQALLGASLVSVETPPPPESPLCPLPGQAGVLGRCLVWLQTRVGRGLASVLLRKRPFVAAGLILPSFLGVGVLKVLVVVKKNTLRPRKTPRAMRLRLQDTVL